MIHNLVTISVILLWSTKNSNVESVILSQHSYSENLVRQHVSLERQKRYLLYPNGDPARVQLIIGLGVPVDLEDLSVTIGYVIKILYHVPQVAEDYSINAFNTASLERAFGRGSDIVVANRSNNNDSNSIKSVDSQNTTRNYETISNAEDVDKNDGRVNVNYDGGANYTLKENGIKNRNFEEKQKNHPGILFEEKILNGGNDIKNIENKNERKVNDGVNNTAFIISHNDIVDGEKNAKRKRNVDKKNNYKYKVLNSTKSGNEGKTMEVEKDNPVGDGRYDELIDGPKTTRWGIYKVFENMMEQKGYNGRECMLRTICEATETPFTHKNGVLGELVHILLTPSSTIDSLSNSNDKDYHTAEMRGKLENVGCEEMYPECEESFLSLFSEIGLDVLTG